MRLGGEPDESEMGLLNAGCGERSGTAIRERDGKETGPLFCLRLSCRLLKTKGLQKNEPAANIFNGFKWIDCKNRSETAEIRHREETHSRACGASGVGLDGRPESASWTRACDSLHTCVYGARWRGERLCQGVMDGPRGVSTAGIKRRRAVPGRRTWPSLSAVGSPGAGSGFRAHREDA